MRVKAHLKIPVCKDKGAKIAPFYTFKAFRVCR